MWREAETIVAERDALRRQLAEAKQWQPVEGGWSHEGHYRRSYRKLEVHGRRIILWTSDDLTSVLLPDDVRLCRRVEGQPAAPRSVDDTTA